MMTRQFDTRFLKYYLPLKTWDLGDGVVINISPMPHDVPEMESFRTTGQGHLVIHFRTGDEKFYGVGSTDLVDAFIGATSGKLARLVIKPSKDKSKVRLQVDRCLGILKDTVFQKVKSYSDMGNRLREAGRADLITRQLEESKDRLSSVLG